jgi:sugar phosphate isomerase/epimerase
VQPVTGQPFPAGAAAVAPKEHIMRYSRREIGRLALTALPAAALLQRPFDAYAQATRKPSSTVHGVNIGTITYSYRSMPDQSAEAILRYIVASGISQVELMGAAVEAFAGAPQAARAGGGGSQTPEQQAAQREQQQKLRAWRTSVSMDRFKALRKMYNDAGVTIYAWKQLSPTMTDAEMEYVFNVAEALGNTHTTLELVEDAAQLKRIGQMAEKRKIYAAYHTHLQGNMTVFDEAFALSKANMSNVDLGHYVAAGGDPLAFLNRFHDRIASFHLKDRTTPKHGAKNVPWGTGDTPLKQILQTVKKNTWKMPATIELEYDVPSGSDAVKEVVKCFDFCKAALAGT